MPLNGRGDRRIRLLQTGPLCGNAFPQAHLSGIMRRRQAWPWHQQRWSREELCIRQGMFRSAR
jgi:hypothetical protein